MMERCCPPNQCERPEADRDTACEMNGLRAEIERLQSCLYAQEAVKPLYDEIKRLQELLRGVGANRYWEGRWRDEKAENERLRVDLGFVARWCWRDGELSDGERLSVIKYHPSIKSAWFVRDVQSPPEKPRRDRSDPEGGIPGRQL